MLYQYYIFLVLRNFLFILMINFIYWLVNNGPFCFIFLLVSIYTLDLFLLRENHLNNFLAWLFFYWNQVQEFHIFFCLIATFLFWLNLIYISFLESNSSQKDLKLFKNSKVKFCWPLDYSLLLNSFDSWEEKEEYNFVAHEKWLKKMIEFCFFIFSSLIGFFCFHPSIWS